MGVQLGNAGTTLCIEIHSDSDLNADYLAGKGLNEILTITGVSHREDTSEELPDSADPLSASVTGCRLYSRKGRLPSYRIRLPPISSQ